VVNLARQETRKVVCHLGKLKAGQLTGVQIHHQRERESRTNPDIDRSRSHLNYDLHNQQPIKFFREAKARIEKAPKAKVRKDSVFIVEAEISAGKKFWEDASKEEQEKFFREAYEFLADRYGRENVVYSIVHNDESTPHMHFGFVPITEDGRLNAKDAVMNRKELARIHKELFQHLKDRGLDVERGEPAKEKHIQPQRWKYEQEKQKLRQVSQYLGQAKQALDGHIKALREIREQERWIDGIQVKEKGIFAKDKVEVSKQDWEYVKNKAKQAVVLKYELKQKDQEMERLRQQNEWMKTDREKARKYDRLCDVFGREKLEAVLEHERTKAREKEDRGLEFER
jgi:hypothetical protein